MLFATVAFLAPIVEIIAIAPVHSVDVGGKGIDAVQ
jgi:hypothetical protein